MNIEIANRLAELRKKNGLSQEQLAEKLGLSRQAVSKWERAEASPDTDNLICLAKLYGVSLDDLLDTEQSVDDIVTEQKERTEEQANANNTNWEYADSESKEEPKKHADSVHFGKDGIHVTSSDGEEVHIGGGGIHINDGTVHLHKLDAAEERRRKRISIVQGAVTGSLFVIVTAVYITLGCLYDGAWPYPLVWPIGWILFLTIPMVSSIFDFFKKWKLSEFTTFFVFGSVFVFMILGMGFNLWHPGWVVFLSIPLWSIIVSPIDKATHDWRHRHDIKVDQVDFVDVDVEKGENKNA